MKLGKATVRAMLPLTNVKERVKGILYVLQKERVILHKNVEEHIAIKDAYAKNAIWY